ncbi:MAG: ABC transporter permease [Alphaproteobacteria bacterium]|nr:ABC transporter permease [Alphaproteobacteria bacterium]
MSEPMPRWVRTKPLPPLPAAGEAGMASASGGAVFWARFRRHRLAMAAAAFLILAYLCVPFAEVIAPYPPGDRQPGAILRPPQAMHLFHEGRFVGPFVYGLQARVDTERLVRVYAPDRSEIQRLRFFCQGAPYRFWGLVEARFHLVCPEPGGAFHPLGTDRLGRDMLSRIVHGARVSLTIGLVGVSVSFTLGLLLGGAAGYFGGWIDAAVSRVIEVLRSLPELPIWLALAAAVPVSWSPLLVYFAITIILGLLDWPGLARAVRGKLLALREEDYAAAALVMGASPARIIGLHLLPNFASHLIASLTLTVPAMILGETALSFLGLGLRDPVTSWGVLLNEAQTIAAIELYPWIILPVVPVILVILAFNFLGDGLRDAADPHR